MDKELIEDKLYQVTDQFNERKITFTKFYSILLNKIHLLYDRNCRTCKMLFANDKTKYIDKFKLYVKQCYHLVWSVEKIQNVKSCKDKKQKNNGFYQNVQCVILKNQNLSKNKKLADY